MVGRRQRRRPRGHHRRDQQPHGGTRARLPGSARRVRAPTSAGLPTTIEQTRLRNFAADLCLDIRGGEAKAGAETVLAVCSSAWTQQWSYGDDGLLRSVADPELCLDSRADDGFVVLERCAAEDAARGDDVRYDLTVQGELLPRWSERIAVAPSSTDPGADIVVKVRDGSDAQRWRTDAASAAPESLSVSGTNSPSPGPASPRRPPTAAHPRRRASSLRASSLRPCRSPRRRPSRSPTRNADP